ncbi:hypothetical protein K2D_28370 [Enterococcus hirae]|nr:hypothetical protein K2D_28370 [Enterococcus hirae]
MSNTWVTCPSEGDNTWKQVLIPYNFPLIKVQHSKNQQEDTVRV